MQAIIAGLLNWKQCLSVVLLNSLLFSPVLFANSIANSPLVSQVEYALMENDTTTASLILQYLNDHPVDDLEKQYSQLRLASIHGESLLIKDALRANGDKDLFWQLQSIRQSQVKKPLPVESAFLAKRSQMTIESILAKAEYSLNNFSEYPLEKYPPFLKKLYEEVFTFQRDFLDPQQKSRTSQQLAAFLLKETLQYFFFPKEPFSFYSFYTDYKKYMLWLRFNEIKASFFLAQLNHCPDLLIERQLIETYEVFFFLQAELLHRGLLNQKRKKMLHEQFMLEEQAIFFYEDLYCRIGNSYWLQKILQVTDQLKSSLLTTRQAYYLEKGLLKDLGRHLLAAVEKREVPAQKIDSLSLIQQQMALTQHYQSFYTVHQLKQEKGGKSIIPTLEAIRQIAKKEHASILSFFDTPHYLFALCIGETDEQWQAIPKTKALDQALQYLEQACSSPTGAMEADKLVLEEIQKTSYSIYQQLLSPFFSKGIPAQLIIIPDGRLNYLPFETLCTQKNKSTLGKPSYLVQYSNIRYYPSMKVLLDYEQDKELVIDQIHAYSAIYSKPISAAVDRKDWGALPGGTAEVCAIEALFPTQQITQNPIGFRSEELFSEKKRLLHLAMHAATRFKDRDEPGLVFSNAPDDILFLHEIARFPHLYPVVVLSACETGLGETIPGEGIRSIGQQFLETGSRSTIQSLSKVADASSFSLMDDWYKGLAARYTSTQALRKAKLNFLNQADPFYQHPYFWGGFVAYGQAFRIQT